MDERVREIFATALEHEPEERDAFLRRACGADEKLRREVASLLEAHEDAGGFLEDPVVERSEEDPWIGRRIGPYRVHERIGHGGMGAVYLAVRADEAYEKRVALKVLSPGMGSEEIVRRFRTERQILAGLDHPHIARLLDGGTTEEGLPYFVLEYVEGDSIVEYCLRRDLSVRERLELFLSVCETVHFAHRNLVVHRDLKPGNILVTADGEPKLLDFGIAKLLNPELSGAASAPTRAVARLMTPQYASPEQVRGGRITTASDVYSLGVLLYELLTGVHPYQEDLTIREEIERAVTELEPERPSAAVRQRGDDRLGRRLAGDLDAIVAKALRKEPEHRYASVDQFAEDLRDHLAGRPVSARRGTWTYRAGKFLRRHRVGMAATAVVLLALGIFGVSHELQRRQIEQQRDRAERVSAFLMDLFEVADPYRSPGETVTARDLLERGAERLEEGLEDQPELRATLLRTIGVTYQRLGLFDEARPRLDKALELRRNILGSKAPEVAQSLSDLADLAVEEGEYGRAEALYREVLKLRRRLRGREHPTVAATLNDLGVVLYYQGELDRAEERLQEALALRRRLLEDGHPEMAETLSNLATVYRAHHELAEAEPLFREALSIHRRVHGDDHPLVAVSLNNLAAVLASLDREDEAETLYRRALAIRRRALGDGHPHVAETLSNLGRLLRSRGEIEAAEPLLREALAIRRNALSDRHPSVANSLLTLAELLADRGDYGSALSLAAEALTILREAFPPDDHRTALVEGFLGDCLLHLGRPEEAEGFLVSSYEVLRARYEDGSPRVRRALERLVAVYRAQGETAEAAVYEGRLREMPPES